MQYSAHDQRGLSDLIRSLTRDYLASAIAPYIDSIQQSVQAQIGAATNSSTLPIGGQDPAAVARAADEGSSGSAARADHVHPLDITGGEAIDITGLTSAFVVEWLGVQLGILGRAIELDFNAADFTVEIVDGVAAISSNGATVGTLYGPPTSGTQGIDLGGARWSKPDSTWIQTSPGMTFHWGDAGAQDILLDANWTGGAKHDPYVCIEPGQALWEYGATHGWVEQTQQNIPMVPAATPPFSAARSKASLLPLPADTDWLVEELQVVAAGSVGVWDTNHRWDLSLCQNGTTLATVQQTTQAEAVHTGTVNAVVAGGLVLALKALNVSRPGLLAELGAVVSARRVRQT